MKFSALVMLTVRFVTGVLISILAPVFPRLVFGTFFLFVLLFKFFKLCWIWFVGLLNLSSVMTREVQHRWDFSPELEYFWLQQQRILCPSLMLRLIGRHSHYRYESYDTIVKCRKSWRNPLEIFFHLIH